jgi:hypothetical protein
MGKVKYVHFVDYDVIDFEQFSGSGFSQLCEGGSKCGPSTTSDHTRLGHTSSSGQTYYLWLISLTLAMGVCDHMHILLTYSPPWGIPLAGGKYMVDVVEIQRVIGLPMHGEDPEKALTAKYVSQNEVYGMYSTHEGGVVISEINARSIWFSTQLITCKIL